MDTADYGDMSLEEIRQAQRWDNNFFRHGVRPGESAAAQYEILRQGLPSANPIDLRLSVIPWPAHLADLRQHPGDIALQVNVGRTIDPKADVDAEHERNHRLADAILEKLQPETMRIATALHEAMANVGRCDECDTIWVGDGLCPYCAGFEDGAAETDGARRATEFAVKQQQMLGDQLDLRDAEIYGLRNEAAALLRQRDLAQHDVEMADRATARQRQMKEDWIDRYHKLADQQARLRKAGAWTLAAIVGTFSAGSLAWVYGKAALPWLVRHANWTSGTVAVWLYIFTAALGAFGNHMWRKSQHKAPPLSIHVRPHTIGGEGEFLIDFKPPVIHAQELPGGDPPDNTSSP